MNTFDPSLWALWCACALLSIAAVVNVRSLMVPNWLSLSAMLAGWLVAIGISGSTAMHGGGLGPSLAASAVGLLLLLPFYKTGWLGAGCVKMQMAFGAWVGCGMSLPAAVLITAVATATGVALTAIGFSLAVLRLRSQQGAGVGEFLFPAQLTLSVGSVCGVIAAAMLGWM